MTKQKAKLNRYLLLDKIIAIIGIVLVSLMYSFGLSKQHKITENLLQHPFAVSNAALDFRIDVLELRKYMLETMLYRKRVDKVELSKINILEEQMYSHLEIVRKDFLGDQTRVKNIIDEMDIWKKIRVPITANLVAGNFDAAESLAMYQASPHIDQILADIDYVITFARGRANLFVEEGRTQVSQDRLMLVLLMVLALFSYLLLSNKLRKLVNHIYDMVEHAATFDELTGAYNRKSFIHLGNTEIERTRRYNLSLSLLMMDLDHFKHVNDSYGHDAGDSVLRQFSEICHQHLRGADIYGRIGGEEFAILLPHSDLTTAKEAAERIRQEVANYDFNIAAGKCLNVTVSVGVADLDDETADICPLLKQADTALYLSKSGGRNRVTSIDRSQAREACSTLPAGMTPEAW
ncbi:MAG: GGDEF domain-containing protein [Oryzomonas sp.]|uniref:GGDEF domain-containing protein n=1 Tax=Oryzomonas sp. TaxID=2855186 RepID=UPI0028433132|nr:GGDEF domain-containing protein [Oryzomonas sp.]MDR3579764.1 GGDEF domain-containing protein [Oryzomonas sp.]